MKHPMQPIEMTPSGVVRFKKNAVVRYLLDEGGITLNDLATRIEFSREDREQFAQLLGYSVSGFGELSYASPETVAAADLIAAQVVSGEAVMDENAARIKSLEEKLADVKLHLRQAAVAMFDIAPEDLR